MKPEPGSRQVLLVVSPANEETRPIVAANLGATYAEAGQKAIVVSTDDLDSGFAPLGGRPQPGSISPEVVAGYLPAFQPAQRDAAVVPPLHRQQRSTRQPGTRGTGLGPAAGRRHHRRVAPLPQSHHGEALVHAVDAVIVVVESRTTTIDQGKRTGHPPASAGGPLCWALSSPTSGAAVGAPHRRPALRTRWPHFPVNPVDNPRAVPGAAQS